MGLRSMDAGTPLTVGTWVAARAGADCALSAAAAVAAGERAAFALTRPPGHHAGADFFGGYCFLNNAALAAQQLRDQGFERVAVLDLDYHHGNGTQAIFYERTEVFFLPAFMATRLLNTRFTWAMPMSRVKMPGWVLIATCPWRGSDFALWRAALTTALQGIQSYGAQALVVSLGLDTFEGDPIAGFKLQSADYLQVGQDLAAAGLPTVLVFEGGYAVAEVGINAVNLLQGFMEMT